MRRRLILKKATLRNLTPKEMRSVAGEGPTAASCDTCAGFTCFTCDGVCTLDGMFCMLTGTG